jgi:Zn ribbon nucleic-acid-binding protein
MSISTHPDNGQNVFLGVDDCPSCGGFDRVHIYENDFYQTRLCRSCEYEETNPLDPVAYC